MALKLWTFWTVWIKRKVWARRHESRCTYSRILTFLLKPSGGEKSPQFQLNSLIKFSPCKYSSSLYFVLGLTSTLDGCPICNACDDLLRIRIAVMGIGILLWQETRCRLSQGRGGGMQVVLQKCYRGQVSVKVLQKCYRGQVSVTVLQRPDQCDRGQASVTVLQGAGQCYSVTESRPGYRWRYVWWDLRPGACTCECDKGRILGNQ